MACFISRKVVVKKKEGKCKGQKQIIRRKSRTNDQLIDQWVDVIWRRQPLYTYCI